MANKIVREIIHAKGIDIGIYTKDFENEYISLTDIAKYRNDNDPRLSFRTGCETERNEETGRNTKGRNKCPDPDFLFWNAVPYNMAASAGGDRI